MKTKQSKSKKQTAPEDQLERRARARARHWRRTNVSESTINWMREQGML